MQIRRRSPLMLLAVLTASLLALAFAGGAMAATQTTGPYQVTDDITHDGVGDTATTTATYTITVPDDPAAVAAAAAADSQAGAAPFVQAISHVDVGVCNDLQDRTYKIQRDTGNGFVDFGEFKPGGDAGSINGANGPVIKWDGSQDPGTVYKYSYTVPGTWDGTPTTLFIKSGSYGNTRDPHDPFTATVQGIACSVTPPTPPGGNDPGNPQGQVAGQQVGGQQQVLGERVVRGSARLAGASGCQRKAFKVSVRGNEIRKVTFKIDGKSVKKVHASAAGKVYSITINPNRFKPGSHLVTAKATFTAASNTKAKTMRVRFARCVRRTAPAFTG